MIRSPSTLHTCTLLFVVCAFIVLNCINQRVSKNDDFTIFSKPSMTAHGPFSAGQEQHHSPIVSPVENGVVQVPLPGETMESFVQPAECKTVKDIHVVLWWKRADRPYDFFSPDLFGVPYAVNRLCKKACVRFVSTRNRSKIAQADMVIFNFDLFYEFSKEMPPRPRPDVIYVYTSMENTNSIPRPVAATWNQFNFFWSYHTTLRLRTSWLTLMNLTYEHILRPPLVSFEKRFRVPLSALISHCWDSVGRAGFLREIMKLMPVHSYGTCFRNRPVKGKHAELQEQNGIPLLAFYKFHLLIENALCTDHVSEKFARGIRVNTIPLVASKDSLPPYNLLQPTTNFLIDVMNFKTVKEVAEEVLKISANKKLFESYMAYKSMRVEDFNPGFRAMMEDRGEKAALCGIAEEMKTREGRLKLAQSKINLKETCKQVHVVSQHFGFKE